MCSSSPIRRRSGSPFTRRQVPPEYRGDAFVTLRGSWNRTRRTGYKVVRLRFANGKPSGEYEDFLTGLSRRIRRCGRGRRASLWRMTVRYSGGNCSAVVEGDPERRRMGLDQHIGHSDMAGETRPLSLQPRVLMIADIVPGPAVECALPHRGRIVRRQVVAQSIALVHHAPQCARGGFNRPAPCSCATTVAKMRRWPPSASKASTSARSSSPLVPMLLAEPTATKIVRPSRENARSRVEWPPLGMRGTTMSGLPRGRRSPSRIGKADDPISLTRHRQSAVPVPVARRRCRTDRSDHRRTQRFAAWDVPAAVRRMRSGAGSAFRDEHIADRVRRAACEVVPGRPRTARPSTG